MRFDGTARGYGAADLPMFDVAFEAAAAVADQEIGGCLLHVDGAVRPLSAEELAVAAGGAPLDGLDARELRRIEAGPRGIAVVSRDRGVPGYLVRVLVVHRVIVEALAPDDATVAFVIAAGRDRERPGVARTNVIGELGSVGPVVIGGAGGEEVEEPLVAVGRPPASPVPLRGDANGDGVIDISDPIAILSWLFLGGTEVACPDAADVDASGDADISDATLLLHWLFLGGAAPAGAPVDCA